MKKQLKVGAYLRVSTDKQVQIFEGSLETQKYRMQEFVKNKNKENKSWGEIIDFYVDEGLSAGTVKRPQYQRMMSDVRSGKINLILVADISRLSRSVHDFSILLRELEQYNASYLSMKEQFDTTTPAGRLMINMVVNMAQFEREQTSERVSINCNSRAVRGYVNGGRTPLGFDRHKEKRGTFIINQVEAEQVRIIFNTFRDRGSVGKTIPIIESLKILPKIAESQLDEVEQMKWTYEKLKALLSNPVYIGRKEVNKMNKDIEDDSLKPWQHYQQVKASWPAIISDELFNEVQDILKENYKLERRRLDVADKRIFLLSGVLTCGECGRPLSGQSAHGKKQVHRYYAHSSKRSRGTNCKMKRVRADELEQVVVHQLTEIMGRVGYFDNLEKKIKESFVDGPLQIKNEMQSIKKNIEEIEREITSTFKLQVRLAQGSEAMQLATEHLEGLGKKKKVLVSRQLELEEIEFSQKSEKEICEEIKRNILDFKKGFKRAPPSLKRRLVHKVLGELVLTDKGLEVYYRFHKDRSEEIQQLSEESNNRIIEFRAKKIPSSNLSKAEESLIPSFANLRIGGSGWGSRTRTCG
ncbi:MAG: hypothetical protein BroJett040_00580 [Oligoflexia bacterium]|nr:MAG: hypothetical protein BroJett040_00580 [Oligoflexia bacterium]